MIQQSDRAVNTPRPTSTHSCDTCTRPAGTVAPITIDTTTRNLCRFCRHSLMYGRLSNILRLVDRFFDGMVTA
jgi:predicted CXXCH cytochrome family protein